MKDNRIEMLKAVYRKIKNADNHLPKLSEAPPGEQPQPQQKKKRGRPRKNIILEVESKVDDFEYGKLSDDAGILSVKDDDLNEELSLMGTKL